MGYSLLIILFLIIRYLFVSTKENKSDADSNDNKNKEPEKINNDSNEYTNSPATIDETNYLSRQILEYLNKSKISYLVSDGGNVITIEYQFDQFHTRIDIYTHSNNYCVLYRILIIDGFPDNRLYQLLELTARLNVKLYEGHFNVFIEQRLASFDSVLLTYSNYVDEDLHKSKLNLLLYILENFRKAYVQVAYENEEPIVAVVPFI